MTLFGRLTDPIFSGERGRNRSFLEAAMAGAALIAVTESKVSLAKRHALDQALETVPVLRDFDVHRAVDLFHDLTAEIRTAPEAGTAKALRMVSGVARGSELARTLARLTAAVAGADGEVSAATRARLEEVCAALGEPVPDLGAARGFLVPDSAGRRPTVVVLGNEKGGTGKSTTAMHLAVALLREGHKVGSIDLDARQGTLSRYVANREAGANTGSLSLPLPLHRRVEGSDARDRDEAKREEKERLAHAFNEMADCAFVVIDTPGNNSYLSRLGHAHADILITPLNDSFLDIDVLARIDRERREVLEPSPYSRMVWEQNERRAAGGLDPIDWIVMRNRLAHIDARNTREMSALLRQLSGRMHFRLEPGFSERVIFRELFYRGLTLLDLPDADTAEPGRRSWMHARKEIEDLVGAVGVDQAACAAPATRAAGTA